jgi:UDP-N-acetylglucosamine 1-carboxyvinyltransferase
MTDWQQPFTVLFTQAQGTSVLHETIFEDRLGYTRFLSKMGANITLFAKCLGEVPCRFRGRNHIHSKTSAALRASQREEAHKLRLPRRKRRRKRRKKKLLNQKQNLLHSRRRLKQRLLPNPRHRQMAVGG